MLKARGETTYGASTFCLLMQSTRGGGDLREKTLKLVNETRLFRIKHSRGETDWNITWTKGEGVVFALPWEERPCRDSRLRRHEGWRGFNCYGGGQTIRIKGRENGDSSAYTPHRSEEEVLRYVYGKDRDNPRRLANGPERILGTSDKRRSPFLLRDLRDRRGVKKKEKGGKHRESKCSGRGFLVTPTREDGS